MRLRQVKLSKAEINSLRYDFLQNQWLYSATDGFKNTTVGSDCKYHLFCNRKVRFKEKRTPEQPKRLKKETKKTMFLTNKMNTASLANLPSPICLSFFTVSGQKAMQITSEVNCSVSDDRNSTCLFVGIGLYRISSSIWLTLCSNPYRLICLGVP